MSKEIKPYNTQKSKKTEVQEMFDNVSPKYDFLNRLLSARIDILWRNKVVKIIQKNEPRKILDVATGTGDLAITLAKKIKDVKITGYDLSEGMLSYGRKKVKAEGLENQIQMIQGDAENMPFEEASFDVVTASFGVRNFENLEKGLLEFLRVLRPGGKIVILEFSQPQKFPMKQLYHFYSFKILPLVGRIFSKDPRAYTYLPESVKAFPYGEEMVKIMESIGCKNVKYTQLTSGIATIYQCEK